MANGLLSEALSGKEVDPMVRSALYRVDYPEYVVAALVASDDGLDEISRRMSRHNSEQGSPPSETRIAVIITDLIGETSPSTSSETPEVEAKAKVDPARASIFPHLSEHFPQPTVVSRFFRRKHKGERTEKQTTILPPAVFEDDLTPLDLDAGREDAFLLHVESILARRKTGAITRSQAVKAVTEAVVTLIGRQ